MVNYSGEAFFEFIIYRFNDKEEEQEIILNVRGRSYFMEGKMHGHPDNCFPSEGDTEILSVSSSFGKDYRNLLTSEEEEAILEQIAQEVQDDDSYVDEDFYEEDFFGD